MDISPDQPLSLEYQLPKDVYYQLIHTLRAGMPPPVTDAPEDLVRRDNDAIARVAAMLPANADEAYLAVQCIAAQADAMNCLRISHQPGIDDKLAAQRAAKASGMMRQADATRRLLLRIQSDRKKREASNKTLSQAVWLEHCAISLMADALGRARPTPIAQPAPDPEPVPEADLTPDLIAEAEEYALINPHRAALIRSLGCLPPKPDFHPPRAALVQAIVTGTTPFLRALDSPAGTAAGV
ncbi:MAG TPA: hypothetical protein VMQ99_02390 [Acetobacteraceae bacterium]|nr:hypothetical protein [Acetobacteraceae bacterium]